MAKLQQMQCKNCGRTRAAVYVEVNALYSILRMVLRCDCGIETVITPRATMGSVTELPEDQEGGWEVE